MKGLIVYKSVTGTTEQYARWLSEETGFETVPVGKARKLSDYDVLIIGSCIRMYKPAIAGWLIGNWPKLRDKKVVFFTVSGALKTDPGLVKKFEEIFPEEIRSSMPYVPLNGRMIFAKLPWFERKLMEFGMKMTEKSNPEEAKKMAEEYDRVDRNDIRPIVERIRQFQS